MKNQLFFLLLLLPCLLRAQENCQGSFTEYYLNSNNIRASFFPSGNKFTDGERGGFLVPYPSSQKLSTIFASSPWIAGFDDAGNLKSATETFPKYNVYDFSVGPLNSIGLPYDSLCNDFDTVWSVFAEDIVKHMMDFQEDFILDDTIPSIFGWPASGNRFFKKYNGFSLPEDHSIRWAPFLDYNGNSLYDPDKGDFPILFPTCTSIVIPDQMMWMVFNDIDSLDNIDERPLRVEIQMMAYAFHCTDNTILNNTVFNRYTIINAAVSPVDSLFFGMWTDYDLGCYADDFIGSDSLRRTEFVYNSDAMDGDIDFKCSDNTDTYGEAAPPIQSMTYLNHPMHSFISYNSEADTPLERYRLLNGEWEDGTPMRPSGDGFDENSSLSPTRFLFSGDPRDTTSWAAFNEIEDGVDFKTVSSVSLGRFDPGGVRVVELAYMFHQDTASDHLGQFAKMYENIDSLRNIWFCDDNPCVRQQLCFGEDCIWPGDFDKNGIADHRDYLMWGVMNGSNGPERNGQISWRGHPGDSWNNTYADINTKHGDGDGNGKVDIEDIQVNKLNFTLTNRYYDGQTNYPKGNEIILSAKPFFNEQGNIEKVNVSAGQDIHDVLGLTFEIEFDTTLFYSTSSFLLQDIDTSTLYYYEDPDHEKSFRYSFVKKDHSTKTIKYGWSFFVPINNLIRLKPGLTIPDSTVIRLRNLKAIDAEGNDLHIGSEPIVIYKEGIVGIHDPFGKKTIVYPNPTKDFIQIQTDVETEAQLYFLHGQMVRHLSKSEIENPVDVSNLASGIYILRILGTGESIKVVVQ